MCEGSEKGRTLMYKS